MKWWCDNCRKITELIEVPVTRECEPGDKISVCRECQRGDHLEQVSEALEKPRGSAALPTAPPIKLTAEERFAQMRRLVDEAPDIGALCEANEKTKKETNENKTREHTGRDSDNGGDNVRDR